MDVLSGAVIETRKTIIHNTFNNLQMTVIEDMWE